MTKYKPITHAEFEKVRNEAMKLAGIGTFRYTFDGVVLFMDESTLELIDIADRYNTEEVIGMKLSDLITYIKPQSSLRKVLKEKGRIHNLEYHFKTITGKDRWVLHDTYLTYDENLKEEVVQAIAKDITQIKKAEDDLKNQTQQLNAIVENSQDWIWEIDTKGDHTYSNHALETILGYEAVELEKTPSFNFMYEDDAKKISEVFRVCVEEKKGWNDLTIRWKHKAGGYRYLESRATPVLDKEGNLTGFRGVDRDVTERKTAEEEKENLYKQIESYNEELKKIIQIASHDFRSPVFNIRGFMFNILDDIKQMFEKIKERKPSLDVLEIMKLYEDVTIPESEKYLKEGINRLNYLLEGLLKLSQLGAVTPEMEKVNVNELVKELQKDLKLSSSTLKVTKLDPCKADIYLIRTIFSNLIKNSVKYKRHDIPCEIELSSEVTDGKVLYKIKDNGIGVQEEELNKVFDLFYQSDPKGNEGQGMGLSLVKWAVLKLSGEITLESKLDEGTTFFLSLPKA